MPGNLVKSVMLKITGSDGDTEAKLDKITAKANELGRLHPELKVRINAGAASAKLAVLRREMRDTARDAEDSKGRFGAFGAAVNELTVGIPRGVGEMSTFSKVMAVMNVATGVGEPLVAGLTVAVGGLSAGLVAAGAGAGVFGLVAKSVWSGVSKQISAATAAEEKMATARTLKQQDADARAFSKTLKGLSVPDRQLVIGAANAEAGWHSFVQSAAGGVASVLVPALGMVPRVLSLMRGFLAPVESALRGVVAMVSKGLNSQGFSSFISMLQRNAGPMITKLAVAIGHVVVGIGGILRAFMPVAQEMGSGLDSITAKFAKWGSTLSGHSGFQSLMAMFKSETPMAVSALKKIAELIKNVASNMTGLSTFGNSKMLLQALNPVLSILLKLSKVPGLTNVLLYLKLTTGAAGKLKSAIKGVDSGIADIKNVASAASNLGKGFSDADAAASKATGSWGSMGGKLSTVLQKLGLMKAAQAEATVATEGETAAQGELDVAMDANPIGLIIVAVAALGAGIYELIKHVTPVRDFFKDLWRDLKNWFSDGVDFVKHHWLQLIPIFLGPMAPLAEFVIFVATHFKLIERYVSDALQAVKNVARDVWGWFVDYVMIQVDAVKTVLGWFGKLGSLFLGWFMDGVHAVESATGRLLSFVRGIPGRIMAGLADLGGMMLRAGEHAIDSLISGITSKIGSLGSTMSGVASKIAGFIGLSPAKEGPLSGGGAPRIRGMHIGQDVASGMLGSVSQVDAASRRLALAAGIGAGSSRIPAGAAAGGAPKVIVEIDINGDQELANWIKRQTRVRGGGGKNSVQVAWGQTH
jgi:hypothetical protein